ncbi:FAD-binding oxidoreductase [Haliangium sp.]|uniref:FAD-binding oxidoreductase n=1 Tax=Haliangium sp. TaxID=2663208 RepID=UPI003D10C318
MSDIGERLARELGAARVLRPDTADAERLAPYGRDESGLGPYPPDCVVLCSERAEVELVLRLAAEHRVPVTPRGAGSGKAGGCLPVRGGIVLSTEAMTRVCEIDPDDLVTVVEPGVITGVLQDQVEAAGMFYPPDPASLGSCSIGGNVATNAGGPRAFRYGVTGTYVLGLEVVLMGGETVRVGRRTAKGVTGYDLVSGFVGSEGTFGVVTEITLGLLPKPPGVAALLAVFADVDGAGAAVTALMRDGVRPRVLELVDRAALAAVRTATRYRFPDAAGAVLLIELDGHPDELDPALLRVGIRCEDAGALEVVLARSAGERRALWEARRLISPKLRQAFPHKISEDICVPRGAVGEMLRRIDRLAADVDVPMACYGHAGDGNLHVNLLLEHAPAGATAARVERALSELFEHTIALRGTLSGEHGIGLAKRRFLPLEQSQTVIEWQRRWKRMWDPHELLNPGKVLPAAPRICHE